MIEIQVNKKRFDAWAKRLPDKHAYAMFTALRAEALRMSKVAWKQYARSEGFGRFKPYAPVTKALRKGWRGAGKGYGHWIKGLGRYYVDRKTMTAYIGVLGRDRFKNMANIQPWSHQFTSTARRHAGGYAIYISRKAQRSIAARLQAKYGRYKRASKRAEFHKMVPRVGWHYVKPRPVASVVARREHRRSIRNITRIYILKLKGERYERNWLTTWGAQSVGYAQSPLKSVMEAFA